VKISLLASGSSGNCTYIEAHGTRLLIDAGISLRQIRQRLAAIGVEIEIETIDALLISHEHVDHAREVSRVALHFECPIYASERTSGEIRGWLSGWERQEHFQPGKPFALGTLQIHPFRISHDACEPCGFMIAGPSEIDGQTVCAAMATDLGTVYEDQERLLSQCDLLIIEANHDGEMLRNGSYPPHLKKRIQSVLGHLSNDAAGQLIARLAQGGRLKQAVLAHLSQNNNRPEIALQTVQSYLNGSACCRVHLSYRDRPTELLTL
jgi:phosphoribosyl 1,2-cyclic phosphodiesterase